MKQKNFLDKFFENKTKKDILYIHIMTIFLIGFIIYYFIYPVSSSYQIRQKNNYSHNMEKLNKLKIQKNTFTVQIINLTKTIKKLSLKKISLHKQKLFFDDLVSLLDFAEFNKYKWANYVKNIVHDAKNEGLKLIDFKNELFNDNNNTFINKKMDITVNIKGEYKNLIYYIYKYENTKELLRVNELNINEKGDYMIKFSLYGYKK
ncbi:conserved hypothetical protein [Lebetimonas natsushimae]|uniref:Type IV pilus assembly protein PilO n=1 Tax=Lebetimonas natsushimae TaxID=1936991 RepID=A0A292YD84_9BACT|nr:hypothetical protein [Lebetimonas natsushimae]GAX87290.1 conserved hypothetical protein [Lebetimonas natsushimae]